MSSPEWYPLASPKGEVIPFDVGFPYGLVIANIALTVGAAISLPADSLLAVLFATCGCVVSFDDATPVASLTLSTFAPLQVFVPKDGTLSIQIPALKFSVISSDGASTGKLYVTLFRPYQSLGKDLLTRRM